MSTQIISLGNPPWRIALAGCDDVAAGLRSILYGWNVEVHEGDGPADARIEKRPDGYYWASENLPKPKIWQDGTSSITPMNVVSDIHDVLFDWFLLRHPSHLCLHAAAVFMGGLVCFPAVGKAGKSTLCAELAARGHLLYCDDVLPIDPSTGLGLAMGIAPLLRLPLPKVAGEALRGLVQSSTGPRNKKWVYLTLPPDRIAPFGETAKIREFILLERKAGARAQLLPVSPAEMLKEVIQQNFGGREQAPLVLDRLSSLVGSVPNTRLVYDDLGKAADLLCDHLARSDSAASTETAAAQPLTERLSRRPGLSAREVDGEIFLACQRTQNIHHLDRMASAVWRALEQSLSRDEIIAIFSEAFPEVPRRKLARDIHRLLAEMVERGLIEAETA